MAVQALLAQKGLYLLVHPNGPKYWRTEDRFLGKRKTPAPGVYPEIPLAVAKANG
jgi:hypothetical protein